MTIQLFFVNYSWLLAGFLFVRVRSVICSCSMPIFDGVKGKTILGCLDIY
jgi:hypothetical protein